MRKFSKILSITLAVLLGLFSFQVFTASTPQKISHLSESVANFYATSDQVSLATKTLTAQESFALLSQNVLEKGYVPMQFTIRNNSDYTLVFSQDSLNLPLATKQEVMLALQQPLSSQVLSKSVSFFFPYLQLGVNEKGFFSAATHFNQAQDRVRGVPEAVIPAHTCVSKMVFVPKDFYQNHYTITLKDRDQDHSVSFKKENTSAIRIIDNTSSIKIVGNTSTIQEIDRD